MNWPDNKIQMKLTASMVYDLFYPFLCAFFRFHFDFELRTFDVVLTQCLNGRGWCVLLLLLCCYSVRLQQAAAAGCRWYYSRGCCSSIRRCRVAAEKLFENHLIATCQSWCVCVWAFVREWWKERPEECNKPAIRTATTVINAHTAMEQIKWAINTIKIKLEKKNYANRALQDDICVWTRISFCLCVCCARAWIKYH